MPQRKSVGKQYDEDDYQDWGDDSGSADDTDEVQDWTELCPSLLQMIISAVEQLGGIVVPKMNWSCPSDATWLSPFNNMQCANAEQVRTRNGRVHLLVLFLQLHMEYVGQADDLQ
jgi:hypothetical protein